MSKVHVKTGDTVILRTGDYEDKFQKNGDRKTGKVVEVSPKEGKVIVEGINMIFKHEKPSYTNQQGGIVEKEAPIDISNVMYLYKGKPVRVGFQGEGSDKKRVAKVSGKLEAID